MLSSKTFLNTLSFSFSRKQPELSKAILKRHFDSKVENFQAANQKLQERLSLSVQPNPRQTINLLNRRPKMFVDESPENSAIIQKVDHLKSISQKYELAKVMLEIVYKNQYILPKLQSQQLENLCRIVEKDYGFTKEQIQSIFTNYCRTVNPALPDMLETKFYIFREYLQMQREQITELLTKNPLLLPASTTRIKETIVLFLAQGKSLEAGILNRQKIIGLLHEFPQIFLMGRHQILDLVSFYREWDMQGSQLWRILMKDPVLLNNFPYEVMPLKRKLFRYFKFTTQMGRLMLTQYPLTLVSSVGSLEAKLIFIRDRLKLPIDTKTIELLQFKFHTLRPRGEMLVRVKQPFNSDSIIEFMRCSQEQFIKKTEIAPERFLEQKQRYPETDEIDFRRRKVLKGSGVEQKIRQHVEEMRAQLSLN